MPFVFWNVSEVSVDNFYIKDPQLWALNIMNGKNLHFNNIYVNATAADAPWGKNWVQNTDGFGKYIEMRIFVLVSLLKLQRYHGRRQRSASQLDLSRWR